MIYKLASNCLDNPLARITFFSCHDTTPVPPDSSYWNFGASLFCRNSYFRKIAIFYAYPSHRPKISWQLFSCSLDCLVYGIKNNSVLNHWARIKGFTVNVTGDEDCLAIPELSDEVFGNPVLQKFSEACAEFLVWRIFKSPLHTHRASQHQLMRISEHDESRLFCNDDQQRLPRE